MDGRPHDRPFTAALRRSCGEAESRETDKPRTKAAGDSAVIICQNLAKLTTLAMHRRRALNTMVTWDDVTRTEVLRAIRQYDRLGPERFFAAHGFVPTTTYELVREDLRYPPNAILGTAYEFATGRCLASGDFEGGKSGAARC